MDGLLILTLCCVDDVFANSMFIEFSEVIFSYQDREDANLISYEEFGSWYNSGGYTVAPWLELLDLSKWPGMTAVVERRPSGAAPVGSVDDTVDDEDRKCFHRLLRLLPSHTAQFVNLERSHRLLRGWNRMC